MKCLKCNKELQRGAAFCSYCGAAVEQIETIKKISLRCENCAGTLTVDSDKTILSCPYCGHQTLILENDVVTIEKIRTAARREIELEKIKSTDRLYQSVIDKEKKIEVQNQVEKFKKSKLFKFLISVFFIAALVAFFFFSRGKLFAGIVAVIQAVCFGIAWCMGMQIIKEKRQYMHLLITIIGTMLVIPTFRTCGSVNINNDAEFVNWNVIFLGSMIPETKTKEMEIHTNTESELDVDVVNVSEGDYYEYIVVCKEMGYVNEIDETFGFSAYNDDGYYIDLSHYDDELSICVKAPAKMQGLEWNEHKISTVLYAPKSTVGSYVHESEEQTTVVVGNTSENDYAEYVDLCIGQGFNIDAEKVRRRYEAYDVQGNYISISYEVGNKEMQIILKYPMEFKEITWPTIGIATLAPIPESLSAKVTWNQEWVYTVYVADTSEEEFEKYTQKCVKAGFDKDISTYENHFSAKYSDDISISVIYQGFNVIYISISGSISEDYSLYTR